MRRILSNPLLHNVELQETQPLLSGSRKTASPIAFNDITPLWKTRDFYHVIADYLSDADVLSTRLVNQHFCNALEERKKEFFVLQQMRSTLEWYLNRFAPGAHDNWGENAPIQPGEWYLRPYALGVFMPILLFNPCCFDHNAHSTRYLMDAKQNYRDTQIAIAHPNLSVRKKIQTYTATTLLLNEELSQITGKCEKTIMATQCIYNGMVFFVNIGLFSLCVFTGVVAWPKIMNTDLIGMAIIAATFLITASAISLYPIFQFISDIQTENESDRRPPLWPRKKIEATMRGVELFQQVAARTCGETNAVGL